MQYLVSIFCIFVFLLLPHYSYRLYSIATCELKANRRAMTRMSMQMFYTSSIRCVFAAKIDKIIDIFYLVIYNYYTTAV